VGVFPPKMVPFFCPKPHCKCSKYVSTRTLDELTQDTSGQRVKMRESGIAHTSIRIRPFPLSTSPTSHSRKRTIPARVHPNNRKRRHDAAIKTKQALKLTNISNKPCSLHRPHGLSSNKKHKGLERPTTFRARDRQWEERPGTETP
jgi:hypothetical protein